MGSHVVTAAEVATLNTETGVAPDAIWGTVITVAPKTMLEIRANVFRDEVLLLFIFIKDLSLLVNQSDESIDPKGRH